MKNNNSRSESISNFNFKLRKNWQKIVIFLDLHQAVINSLILGLLNLIFFSIVTSPEEWIKFFDFFSLRTFATGILSAILIYNYLIIFLRNGNSLSSVIIFSQSILSNFFVIGYFLSIESEIFLLPISLLLLGLIVSSSYFLLKDGYFPVLILVLLVILFSLQTLSFIELASITCFECREFYSSLVGSLFNLPPLIWLSLSALAITLISLANFQVKFFKTNLLYGTILFWLCLQVLILLNAISLDYFLYPQKTLAFLIFWDFIFFPIRVLATGQKDPNQNIKLILAVVYHFSLFLIVFFSAPIINLFNRLI